MLEVKAVKKTYGAITAVDGVSFKVSDGETIGLLGPNGAGKTTTISMLAGLLTPTSGQILIEGRRVSGDTDPLKRQIGLVPQDLALYDEMSAIDNLSLFGALYDLSGAALRRASDEALELVGLTDRAKDKVRTFSGGMKRRLNLAAALLHDPKILLLDEPTVGVDPQSRNAIFDNLELLKKRGKTLVYTTHYMEEAERLCDRLVIVDHGKVIADDTLDNLYKLLPVSNVLSIDLEETGEVLNLERLNQLPEVKTVELAGRVLKAGVRNLSEDTPRVLNWLVANGYRYSHVASERANLESVFLNLTGRSLRDA